MEKAELTGSIRHIARFLKSVIPIYSSKVPDTACRKTRKRRIRKTQAFAKRFVFHANAVVGIYVIQLWKDLTSESMVYNQKSWFIK